MNNIWEKGKEFIIPIVAAALVILGIATPIGVVLHEKQSNEESDDVIDTNRFITVATYEYDNGNDVIHHSTIVYDFRTNVEYSVSEDGVMTPLYDENGNVLIHAKNDLEYYGVEDATTKKNTITKNTKQNDDIGIDKIYEKFQNQKMEVLYVRSGNNVFKYGYDYAGKLIEINSKNDSCLKVLYNNENEEYYILENECIKVKVENNKLYSFGEGGNSALLSDKFYINLGTCENGDYTYNWGVVCGDPVYCNGDKAGYFDGVIKL